MPFAHVGNTQTASKTTTEVVLKLKLKYLFTNVGINFEPQWIILQQGSPACGPQGKFVLPVNHIFIGSSRIYERMKPECIILQSLIHLIHCSC